MLATFLVRKITTRTLLDGTLTVTLIPTLRPTLALLRQRLYRTSEASLKLRILKPHNIRVAHKPITLYDDCLLMSRTKTNRRTDREQYTRSNAATARLPTLVKPAETLARDWTNTNERRGIVTSAITLLSAIYKRNIKLTGILRHV